MPLESRRRFLKQSAAAVVGSRMISGVHAATSASLAQAGAPTAARPWYTHTLRWMQTNIAEVDVTRYDIPWWRQQWKRTATQGVVINAGGIVAYYPTEVPLHRK